MTPSHLCTTPDLPLALILTLRGAIPWAYGVRSLLPRPAPQAASVTAHLDPQIAPRHNLTAPVHSPHLWPLDFSVAVKTWVVLGPTWHPRMHARTAQKVYVS